MNTSGAKGKKGLITTIMSVLTNWKQIFRCSMTGSVQQILRSVEGKINC
jgi:hypothetical protein